MGILDRSESRGGYAVRVLAVHTSEGFDKPVVDDAAALRDATWWVGSSHAIADNDPGSLLTPAEGCVPYDRASWTLRSGNRWSENIELVAQAGWTRAQWLARPTLLDRCAYWLAVRSKARNIPLVKLTPAEYRAGKWGVIGHHDHTVGYSDGTHWDPGPGFPWDVVLAKANAYRNGTAEEFDMTVQEDVADIKAALGAGNARAGLPTAKTVLAVQWAIQAQLASAIPLILKGADVDETAVVEGLKPLILSAVVPAVVQALREEPEVAGGTVIDEERLAAITEQVFRQVLGGLDESPATGPVS